MRYTERTTVDDLIAVSNQIRELEPLMDDSDWNFATASQMHRVATFIDREIARREKRMMPLPLGEGVKPDWAQGLGGSRPLGHERGSDQP